ncbi:efflux RND transporter periplasmic adaptor subunit [Legionella sp. km772]|uniref:efflux RND transporter periplasmic adaptor subunit n=1 Tax=Legionella sp. km772 TaxID=2498111 RepID=UPI001F2AA9E6|nr:efflux RND transporter periplasmic adaptor subunit [Legionella sp. km772]
MLIFLGILFGAIFAWKLIAFQINKRYLALAKNRVITVSTMKVSESLWQPTLKSVGSLRAQLGVDVTTELAGMVQTIYFKPGAVVKKGEILVQLNADTEIGLLHALQAQVELAKITYQRDKAQYAIHAVSKQTLDTDKWNLKNLEGQVEEQAATVAKKTLVAPFAGQLGINQINPGQYLNTGNPVTTLQQLDPLYVDFYLPQQDIAFLKNGQKIKMTTDAYPHKQFEAVVSTIQPVVDANTRNIQVEATVQNPELLLKPGMFTRVEVEEEVEHQYLTLPQSAISFNPYGNIVYVVKESTNKDDKNQPELIAKQVFVTLGDTRGEQVAVLKGIEPGETIVTSGQLKLRNGSSIKVNNKIQPGDKANPKIQEK